MYRHVRIFILDTTSTATTETPEGCPKDWIFEGPLGCFYFNDNPVKVKKPYSLFNIWSNNKYLFDIELTNE